MTTGSSHSSPKSSLLYAIAKGGSLVLAGQLIGKGLHLLFRLGAARYLHASGYGLLVLGITISKLTGKLGMAGFDRTALRYGSEQFGKTQHAAWSATIRLSLVMSALGGSIAGALLAFFAPDIASFFSKPNVVPIIRILAAAVPLMSIGGVAVASIRSKQDFRPYVIWGILLVR